MWYVCVHLCASAFRLYTRVPKIYCLNPLKMMTQSFRSRMKIQSQTPQKKQELLWRSWCQEKSQQPCLSDMLRNRRPHSTSGEWSTHWHINWHLHNALGGWSTCCHRNQHLHSMLCGWSTNSVNDRTLVVKVEEQWGNNGKGVWCMQAVLWGSRLCDVQW